MDTRSVYLRDASAYDRPNVRSAKRWHFAKDDATLSACGRSALATGAAGTRAVAAVIPETLRCQRAGCRQRWAGP
jgi:hypothetical protein